ncbi:MAG: LURP-one-related family protein [Anaerolineae bacterium]|nr:LURP-one-related family protein [Anaerolineae bacterium]
MQYQMKQRFWTVGDKFIIKNESGQAVFQVIGKVFSIRDKLSFRDMQGNELAYIRQKLVSLRKRYQIYRDGELFADVVKEISFLKDKYTVDIPGPNDYTVKGNFWDHEYSFLRRGREIAHVSKRFFSFTDTYGINIQEGEDDVTILATAVVIDLVNQAEMNAANNSN